MNDLKLLLTVLTLTIDITLLITLALCIVAGVDVIELYMQLSAAFPAYFSKPAIYYRLKRYYAFIRRQ